MTKILFLVAEDWYFLSHRKPLADACIERGWDVVVATRLNGPADVMTQAGYQVAPIPMNRSGLNPFQDLKTLWAIIRLFRQHKPDIVHLVAMKPVLYGGIAALLCRVPAVINALGGLGYLFTGKRRILALLRTAVLAVMRLMINRPGSYLILQNQDDWRDLIASGVGNPDRMMLARGAGVDTRKLVPVPPPPVPPVVFTAVCRMLADKGLRDLAEAAREIRRRQVPAQIWLVGATDPLNPSSLTEEELKGWEAEGILRWLGHRSDISAVWAMSHVAVLPSYREGLPKALLEAAACGKPIITTDAQGCREVIDDGVEGIMVPVKQPQALADAIQKLAEDHALRQRMGEAARDRAVYLYDTELILRQHLDLYDQALAQANR